jgi:hypothetical protein
LQEHLQVDLKNEEGFYLDTVLPFGINVTNMTEMRRREEDLPSPNLDQTIKCMLERES